MTRTPRWKPWAVCTAGARLPVSMAPLALVLAGFHVGGGVTTGGVLVAAHTLGEIAAASIAGVVMDRWCPRRGLAICLAAEVVLFAALAALVAVRADPAGLAVVATLAGAVPAGAPGGLRSALSDIMHRDALGRGLAIDTMINQASWVIGPMLVGVVGAVAGAPIALATVCLPPAIGAAAALGLPRTGLATTAEISGPAASLSGLARIMARPLVLTAVWRLVFGIMTVAVVPLFQQADAEALPGLALAAFAVGAAAGSLLYTTRRSWPGHPEHHADVALILLGTVLLAIPLAAGNAPTLVAMYGLAGLLEGPIMLARSLHLERILPPNRRSTGFSLQYAAIGVGFGAAGVLLAPLITLFGPAAVVAATGLAVALTGVLSALTGQPLAPNTTREGDRTMTMSHRRVGGHERLGRS